VFEALLWLPVFLIALSAVIEFGMVLNGLHAVKLAARAGAKHAAELSPGALDDAATDVRSVVDRVLSSSGYKSCEVRLEYTTCDGVGNGIAGSCPKCTLPVTPLPDSSLVPGGMVRVTVCVDVKDMTPDLLRWVGASIRNRVAQYSVAFPYENCPL
jgi:Flp pilus assembly protein TadG